MAGKKWCEYCRINIGFSKKEIQEHEETRMHLQNKQKEIKFQRIKIQTEQKKKREEQKQNALLSTANIPKAAKGSQLQKEIQEYRNGVIAGGKAAIHMLIAERTKGLFGAPIEFPDKEDLVLAQNFTTKKGQDGDSSDSQEFQMWRIDICEETGDPCFINNITQAKFYEPPKGHIMTPHQKEQWQYLKEICKQKVDNADNTVHISDWQQVAQEDDYFKINRVEQEQQSVIAVEKGEGPKRRHGDILKAEKSDNNEEQAEVKKNWLEELQQRVNKNEVNANEVMQTVISHKLLLCKNLKEKNQTLKKLIVNDIDIRQNVEQIGKEDDLFPEIKTEATGFKSKKKIKTMKLTQQNDI